MKKILLIYILLILNCSFSALFAQSVGINTDGSAPAGSAILDVKSNSKGILIPRMTSSERTSIVSPVDGLMVYDTDTKNFWYYKSNAWSQVGGISLPYTGNISYNGNSFIVTNGYVTGNGVVGQAFGGAGIAGFSQSGAGGQFSSLSGPGIRTVGSGAEINGKVKIVDGTQGANSVLTSDADGLASWKPLPTAKTGMTAMFNLPNAGNNTISVPTTTHTDLPFVTTSPGAGYENYVYDAGANFNNTTHEYIVPSDGLYHIEFKLHLSYPSSTVAQSSSHVIYPSLSKVTPSQPPGNFDYIFRSWGYNLTAGQRMPDMLDGTTTAYLKAGDKLKMILYQFTGAPMLILGGRYSYFSVNKVE